MGIQIGTQLIAPAGFDVLEKGVTYYFLSSDASRERVHLVQLIERPPKKRKKADRNGRFLTETPTPVARLVALRRAQFELGVSSGAIVHHGHQAELPPWLEPLSGKNLGHLDSLRSNAKKAHAVRVDEMLEVIWPLVHECESVLGAKNPDKVINQRARACKKNETRVRTAFYAYLLFNRSRDALHYPIHKPGKWDREPEVNGCKRGRPSPRKGKKHGHNVGAAMRKHIMESYRRHSRLGMPMTEIYRKAMRKDFGCLEREEKDGFWVFYHPDGEPFPTHGQFDSHVAKELGRAAIQERRFGHNRRRTEIAPSLGPYTQSVANLMERVEADGYVVAERPRGLLNDSTLAFLVVIRKRDYASGAITGIGFSFGSEKAAGYRMASFCEAIDKARFCALFGITIEPWEWPSIGASPHGIADRGAGSTDGGYSPNAKHRPVIRSMPPSHSGQSKAVMESSNPKKLANQEAPSHLKSEKNVFQLVKREIRRVLKDNESFDITTRITPDLWDKVRKPCPNALWSELDKLGRNDAVRITFDNAVRAFLDQIDAVVKADGVYLHGQRYDSKALRNTKLLDKVAITQTIPMQAYVLEACVRHIWIEVDCQLIELDLQAALRVGKDMLYMSLGEIVAREKEMLLMKGNFKEHRHAIASRSQRQYKEETGLEWDGATRKAGRPKSGTRLARQETMESKRATHTRSRA